MPLPSFFNNKQNRSATTLPAGNNASSTSLPSPNPQQQQQQPPPGGLLTAGLGGGGPPQNIPPQQQEYQAYSPPPESLSAQQHFAQAQQQQQSRLPARHQSVSGPTPGGQYGRPDLVGVVGGGLIRQPSGAAESQQTLLTDNNTGDNLSYSSTSSTAYGSELGGPQGVAPVPTKSTLRKPLIPKEPSSGGHSISGLFHRHKAQDQQVPPQDGGIGRKQSQRKSNPPTPQQSPNIPHQIEEDQYVSEGRNRPQSLLPPTREQVDHLVGLRRSDTDAQTYGQRPPPIQQPLTQRPPSQSQGPYYNVATGQYESAPSIQPQPLPPGQQQNRQSIPPNQQLPPQGSPTPQPPPQHQPQHQPPPQQQYPGHITQKPQPPIPTQQQQQLQQFQQLQQQQIQQQQLQQPPSYSRNSSEFSTQDIHNIQVVTNHPGANNPGGLQAHQPQNNPPVSPGASVHTVDTMPGNNPNNPGGQPQGVDGRATPTGKPEGNGGSGMTPSQVQALMTEFDTLQGKYRKVKNLYFERASEIERLQNTMANQRMSQSRTALDDNEYTSRFERLDGAIKNLAFEIRQSWKVIPGWLQPVVNPGAELKGGREMTVVGRAAISRWVVDEILDRYFHPALEPAISSSLKGIENGIRRNSPQPQSIEEDDNLSSKVCSWRMSTIDGIGPIINSQQGKDNRQKLTDFLEEKLTASLAMHLNEPLPPGLGGGVKMIIEISVGLAANLPIESRDVRVWYPLPGEKFDGVFMRPESGLAPLLQSVESLEGKATITVDGKPISQVEKGNTPPPNPKDDNGLHPSNSVKGASETSKKASVFKGIKGKLSGQSSSSQQPPVQQQNPSQTSLTENAVVGGLPKTENAVPGPPPQQVQPQQIPGQEKVRVAGFMAVEVRGKSILIKAPVWT
ncbi:hypothetical protein ABW19_dt0210177 [Dactylella cylindrospora]|nr:hypothetical protein ABW19_dt0210177 [Dactylella cylindrospora]